MSSWSSGFRAKRSAASTLPGFAGQVASVVSSAAPIMSTQSTHAAGMSAPTRRAVTNSASQPTRSSATPAYHRLSVKHLPAYLDEQAFRFNNRRNPFFFRDTILKLVEAKAVPFKALVGSINL